MPRVNLPFMPEWRPRVLDGSKTTTVRTRKYGDAGDTFEVDGVLFELTRVEGVPLREARDRYHREEGFESPDAFEASWARLHPTRGFVGSHTVWVHHYRRSL